MQNARFGEWPGSNPPAAKAAAAAAAAGKTGSNATTIRAELDGEQ
jgi:hypothetical protein